MRMNLQNTCIFSEKAAELKSDIAEQIVYTAERVVETVFDAISSFVLASYISADGSMLTATDYLLYSSVIKSAFSPLSAAMNFISIITIYSAWANKFFGLLNETPEVSLCSLQAC